MTSTPDAPGSYSEPGRFDGPGAAAEPGQSARQGRRQAPPGGPGPARGRGRAIALVVAALVVVGLIAAGALFVLRGGDDTPAKALTPAQRYGFATDGGKPWAPESGRLEIRDQPGVHVVSLGLRFGTKAAIKALGDSGFEQQLQVRTGAGCAPWTRPGKLPEPSGMPGDAKPYATVAAGRGCDEVVVRIGVLDPGALRAGTDYRVEVRVPTGSGRAAAATATTLTAVRLPVRDCDAGGAECVPWSATTPVPAQDAEVLVNGAGPHPFRAPGCRRWYSTASTDFPCLPARGARIMTLGDSITTGTLGEYSWRYRAWEKLHTSAAPVYVGRFTEPWVGDYAVPAKRWGSRHDAEAGKAAVEVAPKVPAAARADRPDLLFLNLGTNDAYPISQQSPAKIAATLDRIVRAVQAVNPDVQVLIAQPAGPDGFGETMADVASRIVALARARSTSRSFVVPVDLRTGWQPDLHTWDGTHPTPAGEYWIAQRWVDRLAGAFAYGGRFGSVPAASPPPAPTGVTAVAKRGSIDLRWDRVPQVNEYLVYMRNKTAGEQFALVQFGFRDLEWNRSLVVPGHVYEFYVVASRSGLKGPPSEIGKVTAK